MNPDNFNERELQALAGLCPLAPREEWERRVHARCRSALGQRHRRGGVLPRLLDAALVMAIGFYLASVVTDAVRLVAAG